MDTITPPVGFDDARPPEPVDAPSQPPDSAAAEAATLPVAAPLAVGALSPAEEAALELSPPQRAAIAALTAGHSASAAGITRMTLYRWLRSDPQFQAAYNTWQQDALATARARLVALTDVAVTSVGDAMRRGDARTGVAVLKAMGLLLPPAPGPTDPEEVQREQRAAQVKAQHKKFFDDLQLPM